jgi:hypothetical protein
MSNVSRLAERRWRRMRSEHARRLEGLERAMRAHPAFGGRAPAPRARNVTLVRDDSNDAA